MSTFVLGFVAAVTLSIVAPDRFASVSKFLRSLPLRALRLIRAE